jgi:ATP-binding cassette subfamily B protein
MKREWIILIFKKFYKFQILIFLVVLIHTFLSLLDPYILKFLIDKAIIPKNLKLLFLLLILLTFLLITRHLFNVISGYLYKYVGSKISFYIREIILNKFLFSSYFFFEEHTKGDILTRVNEDVASFESFLTETLIDILINFLSVIIIYCFLFILNWKLALITCLMLPFIPLIMEIFRKKVRKVAKEERKFSSIHLSFWENILTGLKELRVYKMQNFLQNKFKEIAKISIDKKVKLQFFRMASGFTGEIFSTLIFFPLIFGYGSYLIFKGEFTIGGLISFHTYALRGIYPLLFLFKIPVLLSSLKASIERIDEIYNLPQFKKKSIKIQKYLNLKEFKYLYFKNVSFKYKEKEALKNLSFKIPLGKWTSIIGEIGSGKTTIAYLILKFLKPDKGDILLDEISINDIDDELWYENVSYAGQFPVLFNFGIEENILMGKGKNDSFYEIVKIFKIEEILKKDLKNKGEISEKLSGGEKQKICIARAIFKDSPIIILDEATSNMDIDTEREIVEKLKEIQKNKNKTIIFISHRKLPVILSDYIIHISNGNLVKEGETDKFELQ